MAAEMPITKDRASNRRADKIPFLNIKEREASIAADRDIFIQKLPAGTAKANTHSPKASAIKSANDLQPGLFFKLYSQVEVR